MLPLLACQQSETQPPIAPARPMDAAARDTRRGGTETGGTGGSAPTAGTGGSAPTAGTGGGAGTGGAAGAGGGGSGPAPAVEAGASSDSRPVAEAGAPADTAGPGVSPDAGGAGSDSAPVVAPTMEATWSYTMCDKKALMFPNIDKNKGVFPIGSCPPPANLNRACGAGSKITIMKAMAQTYETGYWHPPEYAFDEHLMTRWSSNTMPTSWIQFDLGTEQSFKRIYLAWELAHASDYDIVTSNDGTTWTTLKEVRGGNGFQDILDVDGKARYVRMNGVKRGVVGEGPYGYSLFDFTICGERP
jgi:hypothetical protein